jgi:NAD(P)-dependent dehydrogenase (short-subunit alcohol dehydrogenase family)
MKLADAVALVAGGASSLGRATTAAAGDLVELAEYAWHPAHAQSGMSGM